MPNEMLSSDQIHEMLKTGLRDGYVPKYSLMIQFDPNAATGYIEDDGSTQSPIADEYLFQLGAKAPNGTLNIQICFDGVCHTDTITNAAPLTLKTPANCAKATFMLGNFEPSGPSPANTIPMLLAYASYTQ